MSESPREAQDRARTARVDLGADTLPGGTGSCRSLTTAPAPSLVAQVAESDETAGLHVTRLAELLEPHVSTASPAA